MEKFENNTLLMINFFKNNYIKFLIFIFISIITVNIFSYQYINKKKLYYSNFKVMFNKGVGSITTPINLGNAVNDFVYFLQQRNISKKKVLKSRHTPPIVQLEINHESLSDMNIDEYNNLIKIVDDYKQNLVDQLDEIYELKEKEILQKIKENEKFEELYREKLIESKMQNSLFKSLIINNNLFSIYYDKVIQTRSTNTLLLKNSIITVCICLIIIFLILWFQIIRREIKKNS